MARSKRLRAVKPQRSHAVAENPLPRRARYWLILGCAVLLGAFLRLHILSTQLLLDDEWHSLRAITMNGFSYWNVLTRFDAHDNSSMPLNLYALLLYHNFALTEWLLRLPLVLAGLSAVVVVPFLLRPLLGERVSLTTAFLLAISPFLIFYSRYYRAYGFVALLGFAALLFAHRWLTTGQRRSAVAFLVVGVLAVYFHLLAAIAVFSPLAAALGILVTRRPQAQRSKHSDDRTPSDRRSRDQEAIVGAVAPDADSLPKEQLVASPRAILAVALCVAVCLGPLVISVLRAEEFLPWVGGSLSLSGLITAATLISGSSNLALNLLFVSLWIAGHVWLGRQKPVLNWIFLCVIYAYVLATIVARPTACYEGRVMVRYAIVIVPIALSTVSLALDRLLQTRQARKLGTLGAAAVVTAFVVCLGAAGPLWQIYTPPNDFTNHVAFQGVYSPLTWTTSDAPPRRESAGPWLRQNQVPEFYGRLAGMRDVATVIEYPFDICDFNDQLYYYQHFHKKRVLAGYYVDPSLAGFTSDLSPEQRRDGVDAMGVCLDGIYYFAGKERLRFQNTVDLADAADVARSAADVLILHKSAAVMTTVPHKPFGQCHIFYHFVDAFRERFQAQFGPPLYEDDAILCFKLR